MQSAVALLSKQSTQEPTRQIGKVTTSPSGFFEAPPALSASSLAAAVVIALHRGLVAEPEREHLPLRVSG